MRRPKGTYRCGGCGALGHNRRGCPRTHTRAPNTLTPIQQWAHGTVKDALRLGAIERQPCEVCGSAKAQAHHDDYLKPLEVRWLCVAHHRAWHREHGPAANIDAPQPDRARTGDGAIATLRARSRRADGAKVESGADPGLRAGIST